MPTILDYARLSKAVYKSPPEVDGWTCANFRAGLGSGLQAAVFTKGQETVVAFKGTTPTSGSDIVADLKLGTGMNTSYFSDAEAYVAQFAGGAGVTLCGHSLGGAIAQVAGNRRRLAFVTFNAPGVALVASRNVLTAQPLMTGVRLVGGLVSAFRHPFQMARDVRSAFHTSLGVNLRLSGDVVSMIGLHYGRLIDLPGSGNPLVQHKMETMLAAVEASSLRDVAYP